MDASSIPIALGEPIGGGLFVSNIVLAFVVFVGGRGSPVEVERRAFLRDVGFYCGATLLVSVIAYDQVVCPRQTVDILPPPPPLYCVRRKAHQAGGFRASLIVAHAIPHYCILSCRPACIAAMSRGTWTPRGAAHDR